MNMLEWAKREIELACNRERGDKDPNEWGSVLLRTNGNVLERIG